MFNYFQKTQTVMESFSDVERLKKYSSDLHLLHLKLMHNKIINTMFKLIKFLSTPDQKFTVT